jgi:exonuclease SbcC
MSKRLKKLRIRNFRAHRKLVLTFGPGVTSIIGSNAAGKSTIIRAIRYVAMNKPDGESVISWDAKQTKVSLTISKDKIIRTRSKSVNTYRLNKQKPYKAFGRGNVPPAIKKVLNLSDINFQTQHEAPFWFCKTAGQVSRELNTIVNLDSIDKTLSSILASIAKSKATVGVVKERLLEAKERKQGLVYIKEKNVQLLALESLEKAKIQNSLESALLADLLQAGGLYAIKRENSIAGVSGAGSVLSVALKRLKIGRRVLSLKKLLKSAKKLKRIVQHKPRSFRAVETLFKSLKKILIDANELNVLIEQIDEKLSGIKTLKKRIESRTQKIDKIMKERCPLCRKKL